MAISDITARDVDENIVWVIKSKLEHYKSLKTYTDCEEYRREGAVGVLEDILTDIDKS